MADVLSGLVTILPFRIPFFFFLHSLGFTKTTPTPSPLFFSRLSSSLSVKTIDCQFIESTPVRGDRWFLSITISPFLSLSEVVQLTVPGKGNQIGTAFPQEEWLFGFNEGGGAPLRRETSTTTASRSWKLLEIRIIVEMRDNDIFVGCWLPVIPDPRATNLSFQTGSFY